VAGRALHAHVFAPPASPARRKPAAILLFHGGGWSAGAPEWTFDAARRFAAAGLVAIAIEYRLSEGRDTPIEALADACAAFGWARANASDLGLSGRVAGYGVSAGGHLVASTATVGCPAGAAGPDALLLWSPALDLARDSWFERKLQGRARAAEHSPVEHVRSTAPPTSIVQGAEDTLTPLAGAERFCAAVRRTGAPCELNVHKGVGHLLTRNLANQEGDYDPDPAARAAGIAQHLRFLREAGMID
jgi:acetyl esterase/lipase